jgi:hypothetical protein
MRSFQWMFLLTLSMFLGGVAIAQQGAAPTIGTAAEPVAPCELPPPPGKEKPVNEATRPNTQSPKAYVKDIMTSMMMPAASGVWNAVATVTDQTGVHEFRPKTDDEWNAVIAWANMLVETPNLLMVPGRKRCVGGEIPAAYFPDWRRKARELQEGAVIALIAARKHDADALAEAGERIDVDCDECHEKYQIAQGDPENWKKVLGTYKLTPEEKAAGEADKIAEAKEAAAKTAPKAPAAAKPAAPAAPKK